MLDNTIKRDTGLPGGNHCQARLGRTLMMGLGRGVHRRPRSRQSTDRSNPPPPSCVHVRPLQTTPPSLPAAGLDVSTLHEAVQLIGGRQIETEASGNVTLETIR